MAFLKYSVIQASFWMFFRIFNQRFTSNSTNYGQVIVQWVEFNIKRPFVYTGKKNLAKFIDQE